MYEGKASAWGVESSKYCTIILHNLNNKIIPAPGVTVISKFSSNFNFLKCMQFHFTP